MNTMLILSGLSVMGAAGSIFWTRRFWKFDVIATSILVIWIAWVSPDRWTAITCLGMLASLGIVVAGKIRTDHLKVKHHV